MKRSPLVGTRSGPDTRYAGLGARDDFLYGNVSGGGDPDGEVTSRDALLASSFARGEKELSKKQQRAADVDGDGKVTANDAELINKRAVNLIEKFPVEEEGRPPQELRQIRKDVSSLKQLVNSLLPGEQLPPWRRKRLRKAKTILNEASKKIEEGDQGVQEAKSMFKKALELFRDNTPPEEGSGGDPSKQKNGSGGGSGGDSEAQASAVSTQTLVLGAGVFATGIIALAASN